MSDVAGAQLLFLLLTGFALMVAAAAVLERLDERWRQ
jgi:hypothetical protein